MAPKRVAVIGAGASGLTAIKCCLDEGLDVVCFERTDSIGGLWHYTEEVRDGQACVMKSTVINTSKEMMCYSDFLIPKEYPNYLPNALVLKYFQLYMDHFDLKKHIRFNNEVKLVTPTPDHNTSGKWTVKSKDKLTGKEKAETYDGIILCTGHHADTNMPTFPGQDKFKGRILHSHAVRNTKGFENKRIVVIGIGNSGGDILAELSPVAAQTFMSTRRGTWVMNKLSKGGLPFDMVLSKRSQQHYMDLFPSAFDTIAMKELNERFDHKLFSLQPNHLPSQQHPTVNDTIGARIANGSIKVKGDVKRLTETGVEFQDGTFEDNIDVIILATGYIFGFPYLDKNVLEVKNNRVDLYKRIFPPNRHKNTLAIIGCFQPVGALMPISELQCRISTRVFKGDLKLPSNVEMMVDNERKQEALTSRYVPSLRHTMQVDYVPYLEELAKLNGCKPNILKLFLSDPVLAYHCYFGPCVPSTYRLMGPGVWGGARDAILGVWERHNFPLRTRDIGPVDISKTFERSSSSLLAIFVVFVAFFVYLFCF